MTTKRKTVVLTDTYQEVTKTKALITVLSGAGPITVNDQDAADNEINYLANPSDQFENTAPTALFIKGAGITLIIDEG